MLRFTAAPSMADRFSQKNLAPLLLSPLRGCSTTQTEGEEPDDAKVAFEERSASLEFNGGLDRQQAEAVAAEELGWPEPPPLTEDSGADTVCPHCGGEGCPWCQPDDPYPDLPAFLDRRRQ